MPCFFGHPALASEIEGDHHVVSAAGWYTVHDAFHHMPVFHGTRVPVKTAVASFLDMERNQPLIENEAFPSHRLSKDKSSFLSTLESLDATKGSSFPAKSNR